MKIRYRFKSRTDKPRAYVWEAICEKKIVGAVGLNIIPTDEGFEGWIHSLEVNVPLRRQGIATELIDRLTAYARKENCKCLLLTVDPAWAEAVNLYKKLGFTDTGTRDGLRQLILMRKDLLTKPALFTI